MTKNPLIEQFGKTNILQLENSSFDDLTLDEKLLAYYLSRAILAGRNIAIDQSCPAALEIMQNLETIVSLPKDALVSDVRNRIENTLKQIYINNGIHDAGTGLKMSVDLTQDELTDAAIKAGLSRTRRWILDLIQPRLYPNKCDKNAEDIILGSSNNFYGEGVTQAEVETWAEAGNEQYPLNSKVVRAIGYGLQELVWRTGKLGVPVGMYAKELRLVIENLLLAIQYAPSDQARAIELLISYLETGNPKTWDEFNLAWVGYDTRVDFMLGFVETLLDARGTKGTFEGNVYITDQDATRLHSRLGSEAAWFDSNAPWDDRFNKKNVSPLDYKIVDVVFGSGDPGPIRYIGQNLPNEESVRKVGTKSVTFGNIMKCANLAAANTKISEFWLRKEDQELALLHGELERDLYVGLHEVVGHASGRILYDEDPIKILRQFFNPIEELRADLMALWYIFSPKLEELGLVEDAETIGKLAYQHHISNGAMEQLRRVPTGDKLPASPHMRCRQIASHYVMENTEAVKRVVRSGKTYLCVEDYGAMREAVGELLAEVMRIKGEGDVEAARLLIEKYGTKIDTELRDEIVARAESAGIANYNAIVMPEPRLVVVQGIPVDVKLHYPRDFKSQMLRFGKGQFFGDVPALNYTTG